jgi:hypothetical protein
MTVLTIFKDPGLFFFNDIKLPEIFGTMPAAIGYKHYVPAIEVVAKDIRYAG